MLCSQGEITMDESAKLRLTSEFTGALRHIREDTWMAFTQAADQASIDPYVALSVLLVKIVETTLGESDPSFN
jgi:hypothetical protein